MDTAVTIYAILKIDPSVVYRKTFTILNDTSMNPIQIELNSSNCPYPMIQYYYWHIYVPNQENEISITIDNWGHITSTGPGVVLLTGAYDLSIRVELVITLTITE